MKKLVLMVTLLLAAGCEQPVYEGELLLRKGVFYKPNETTGFTGVHRTSYGSGQLRAEATFKNGTGEGPFKMWYENGQLQLEATFKNGKEEGLARWWHENGQLKEEITYKNHKEEGLARAWDENGQDTAEYCYSKGEQVDMSNCR